MSVEIAGVGENIELAPESGHAPFVAGWRGRHRRRGRSGRRRLCQRVDKGVGQGQRRTGQGRRARWRLVAAAGIGLLAQQAGAPEVTRTGQPDTQVAPGVAPFPGNGQRHAARRDAHAPVNDLIADHFGQVGLPFVQHPQHSCMRQKHCFQR